MESKYKVTIPKPCHEDWSAMTPEQNGRFCGLCTKTVVDFTTWKPTEIEIYLTQNQSQSVCGRFKNEQVDKFILQIPQSVLNKPLPFQKAFLLALFISLGSSLFSCKNHNGQTLGEVAVLNDTVKSTTTTGVLLPPKDSIPENMTLGKIDLQKYDSLVNAGVKMPSLSPPPKAEQVKFIKPETKPLWT